MASVKWSDDALRDLEKLDVEIARRVVAKVGWLEKYFETIVPEILHHDLSGLYKIRVGDYRVVYSMGNRKVICIEAVDHRSKVYK